MRLVTRGQRTVGTGAPMGRKVPVPAHDVHAEHANTILRGMTVVPRSASRTSHRLGGGRSLATERPANAIATWQLDEPVARQRGEHRHHEKQAFGDLLDGR
jgi:hypothetical protein